MNQARSDSMVLSAKRSQSRPRATSLSDSVVALGGRRAALLDERVEHEPLDVGVGCADDVGLHAREDLTGADPSSMPRLSRRATPASMCSSRNLSIASW